MAELRLGYLNYIALIGRIVQEPDLKYTPKGTPVCNFRIAVNRRWRDKETQEMKEETGFFNVATFRRTAELCGDYLKKGSAVLVQGRLTSRSWQTNTGEKRSTVEIVANTVQFLDKVTQEGEPETPAEHEPEPEMPSREQDKTDDIPF